MDKWRESLSRLSFRYGQGLQLIILIWRRATAREGFGGDLSPPSVFAWLGMELSEKVSGNFEAGSVRQAEGLSHCPVGHFALVDVDGRSYWG